MNHSISTPPPPTLPILTGTISTAYQSSIAVAPERSYRPWWFQKCTEFAWFQTAPAKGSIRSSVVDLQYHRDHCKALFQKVTTRALWHSVISHCLPFAKDLWPDVNATNEYYGGAGIR